MLFLDIDGVLTLFIATMNSLTGSDVKGLYRYDWTYFTTDNELADKDEIRAKWKDIICNQSKRFVRQSIPNLELIEAVLKSGVEFECLTARPEELILETQEWLDMNVKPGIKLHSSKDKHLFLKDNDILIDDCPRNVSQCLKEGKSAFLYQNKELKFAQEILELGIPTFRLTCNTSIPLEEDGVKHYMKSSNIVCTSYNKSKRQLKIEFSGSGWYVYDAVPESVWEGILTAESAGKYFHANIKGKFSYRKVV